MLRTLAFAFLTLLYTTNNCFAGDLIEKTSAYSVAQTVDRLSTAVGNAGATVFARIDHAAGAASIGAELAPSQLLIFGNPKLGTPAMRDGITAGLDLPLRVLVYADSEGIVRAVYRDPATLATTHNLPHDANYLPRMRAALDKLTTLATTID